MLTFFAFFSALSISSLLTVATVSTCIASFGAATIVSSMLRFFFFFFSTVPEGGTTDALGGTTTGTLETIGFGGITIGSGVDTGREIKGRETGEESTEDDGELGPFLIAL